jgi:hypothetical protein
MYDPVQIAASITASSHGSVRTHAGQLRLLVPTTFTAQAADLPQRPGRSRRPDRSRRQRPGLSDVITSAAAIQQVLERYPGDEELDLFYVETGAHRIPWRQFCLGSDPSQLRDFAEGLAAGRRPHHPIAIHGTITGTGTARTGSSIYVEHDLRAKLEKNDRRRWLYVRLRTHDPRLLDSFSLGRRFIAIGEWDLFNPQAARVAEIVLWVRRPWQVASWAASEP